jgi:hypothetical protein
VKERERVHLIHDVHFGEDTHGPKSLWVHTARHLQAVTVHYERRRGRGGGRGREREIGSERERGRERERERGRERE